MTRKPIFIGRKAERRRFRQVPATKLIRVDFIVPYPWRKPDDRLSHYALTKRQYILDSCDNHLPGKWILVVTDLHTGKSTEESFEMVRLFPRR